MEPDEWPNWRTNWWNWIAEWLNAPATCYVNVRGGQWWNFYYVGDVMALFPQHPPNLALQVSLGGVAWATGVILGSQ